MRQNPNPTPEPVVRSSTDTHRQPQPEVPSLGNKTDEKESTAQQAKQYIENLNENWPDLKQYPRPEGPIVLLSAQCKELLAYDGQGRVSPVKKAQGKDLTDLEIVPNEDQTISFFKPRSPFETEQPFFALAYAQHTLEMKHVKAGLDEDLPTEFKFNFRSVKKPQGAPSYAAGCAPSWSAINQEAGLLEPLSAEGHVLKWGDSSFGLDPAPPVQIDVQPFETQAVFLVGLKN